ncbi:MAG: Rieske 2Fe-2S domain-containing protein [Alphaproteobacteria bacterium]
MNDVPDGTLLRNLWYLACTADELKPGTMVHREIAGEPILLARGRDGKAFALRDICPHRGIPLSHGRLYGKGDCVDNQTLTETQVECCYHGWRFGADGGCRGIPSLVSEQAVDLDKIRAGRFPLEEKQGLLWLYIPAEGAQTGPGEAPGQPVPEIPGVGDRTPGILIRQVFDAEMDQAVVGLIDPAHGPYVHRSRLWRSAATMQEKTKAFARRPLGFVMEAHTPSKNSAIYRTLFGGDITTEIAFSLPGLRTELIRAPKGAVCGVTAMTPIDGGRTEVRHMFFWTLPWVGLLKPLVNVLGHRFLGQDRRIVTLQKEGLRYSPRMMLIKDADTLAQWYFRMKKAWIEAQDSASPFDNPVPEQATLRWRT